MNSAQKQAINTFNMSILNILQTHRKPEIGLRLTSFPIKWNIRKTLPCLVEITIKHGKNILRLKLMHLF